MKPEPLFNCQARRNLSENEIALNQSLMEVWRLKKVITDNTVALTEAQEEIYRLRRDILSRVDHLKAVEEENRKLWELVNLLRRRN